MIENITIIKLLDLKTVLIYMEKHIYVKNNKMKSYKKERRSTKPRFNFIYFKTVVSIYLKSQHLLSSSDETKIFSMNSLYIGVKTFRSNSTLHDYYFYLFFSPHDLYVFCMNRVLHWPSEMNSESRRCQQSDWWIYIFRSFPLRYFWPQAYSFNVS